MDELYRRLEAATKYALGKRGPEGLQARVKRQQEALQEVEDETRQIDLNGDHRAKVESQLELLRRELQKDTEELHYWQVILQRAGTQEGEKENVAGEAQPATHVAPQQQQQQHKARATTSVQGRTRPASNWKVTPDDSPASSRPSFRREHDDLLEEMVHMATRLKERNVALQQHVSTDRTLDRVDLALTTGASRFRTQHGELQKFTKKSWATMWRLLVLMVTVLLSMIVMFMLIVVTKK